MPSLRTLPKMKPRFCRPPNTTLHYTTLLLVLSFALICLNADAAVKVSSLDKGLVGHWELSQESLKSTTVLADKTPSQNNGTSANTPSFTTDQHGQANKAMTFNGTSDYVNLGTGTSLDVAGNAFSLSFWVKLTGQPASGKIMNIVSKSTLSYSGSGFGFGYDNRSGTPSLDLFKAGVRDQDVATTLSTGVWYNIVVAQSFSGANPSSVTYYVNGSSVGTFSNASAYQSSSGQTAYIGGYSSYAPSVMFNGSIADVRVYNRALSPTEVTALYNAYRPKYQVSTLNKGLVGHWKLSAASKKGALYGDATPNNSDATATGTTATTDRHGQANKALSFNGTSSNYLSLSKSASLNLAGTNKVSLSAWVYPTTGFTNGYRGIIYGDGSGASYAFVTIVTSGTVRAWFASSYLDTNAALQANTWTHLVATYDGSKIRIYVNGVLDNSVDKTGNMATVANTLYLGTADTSAYYFLGSIADVRVYNRALSPTEVAQLYNEYR